MRRRRQVTVEELMQMWDELFEQIRRNEERLAELLEREVME